MARTSTRTSEGSSKKSVPRVSAMSRKKTGGKRASSTSKQTRRKSTTASKPRRSSMH